MHSSLQGNGSLHPPNAYPNDLFPSTRSAPGFCLQDSAHEEIRLRERHPAFWLSFDSDPIAPQCLLECVDILQHITGWTIDDHPVTHRIYRSLRNFYVGFKSKRDRFPGHDVFDAMCAKCKRLEEGSAIWRAKSIIEVIACSDSREELESLKKITLPGCIWSKKMANDCSCTSTFSSDLQSCPVLLLRQEKS